MSEDLFKKTAKISNELIVLGGLSRSAVMVNRHRRRSIRY